MQASLFRRFADRALDPTDFALHFLFTDNNFDVHVRDIIDQLFDPFASDLRRFLARRLVRPQAVGELGIPASDRVVSVQHNSADYRELVTALQDLEKAIRETNKFPESDDRDQRLAEIEAGRTLLGASRVRVAAIFTLLADPLLFFTKKFAGEFIAKFADVAWRALQRLMGF